MRSYDRCRHKGCNIYANFNVKGECAIYCKKHASEGMVDVRSHKCNMCSKTAIYGFKDKLDRYCLEHKSDGMANLKYATCEMCDKKPSFGHNNPPIYCNDHKLDGMVNLLIRKCFTANCNRCIVFKSIKQSCKQRLVYACENHKMDDMVRIKAKILCKVEQCANPAYYHLDKTKEFYCFKHKSDGMINIFTKSCDYDKCDARAYWRDENKSKFYCRVHKTSNMVHIKK